jgi:hypothetical protein
VVNHTQNVWNDPGKQFLSVPTRLADLSHCERLTVLTLTIPKEVNDTQLGSNINIDNDPVKMADIAPSRHPRERSAYFRYAKTNIKPGGD